MTDTIAGPTEDGSALVSGSTGGSSTPTEHEEDHHQHDGSERFEVAALIAAHNEESSIVATVESVLAQTQVPDLILVIADNCEDATVALVEEHFDHPVAVVQTVGNSHRKGGALNHGLRYLDGRYDLVLEMDADTVLHPRFVEAGIAEFAADPDLGGLGARFAPIPRDDASFGARLLWRAQLHEYCRDDALRVGRRWNVAVLSGTASMFRHDRLREVGGWDTDSIVEDYALSIDLREAGWETRAGADNYCLTDVPMDLRSLWVQRLRWYGGTLAELKKRPMSRATAFDRLQLGLTQATMAVQGLFVLVLAATLLMAGSISLAWWSLAIPVLVMIERIYRVRYVPGRGRADYVFALSPLPDLYQLWRYLVFRTAAHRIARGKELAWR